MNKYPPELVTPPLALVALVELPDTHPAIREFLRVQQKPPVNSLSVQDAAQVARVFGQHKALSSALPTANYLKADWLVKHRQRQPAVAVVIMERSSVVGDPNSWTRACEQLDRVRAATKARGARMVIAIVQNTGPATELPDERALVLRRRTDLEGRCLVPITRDGADGSWKKLGRVIVEQTGQFYADEVRRVLYKASERAKIATGPMYAFHIRAAFKAAAFSEFRQDWATAVKQYQSAYAFCQEAVQGFSAEGGSPIQRHAEICAAAEQVHIKLMSLMLHQQRVAETLAQVERHLSSFRVLPSVAWPPPAAASHCSWLARQYSVAGQLLTERVGPGQLPPRRSAQPAFFLEAAAQCVARQRAAAAAITGALVPGPGGAPEMVPGPHAGQLLRAAAEPSLAPRPATDDEYCLYLAEKELAVNHSELTIQALSAAYEAYKKYTVRKGEVEAYRAPRTIYHLARLMGAEHIAAGDPATARKLLDGVAAVYRRERWAPLLASVLRMLRGVAAQLGAAWAHMEYSLELSSLEAVMDRAEAEALARSAVAALLAGGKDTDAEDTSGGGAEPAQVPVTLGSGLGSVVQLAAGFCPPKEPSTDLRAEDSTPMSFGVAFLNTLPVELPAGAVKVAVVDGSGATHVVDAMWEAQAGTPAGKSPPLPPHCWRRCWATCKLPGGSVLRAATVSLAVGRSQLCWDLPAVAPRDPSGFADLLLSAAANPMLASSAPFPMTGTSETPSVEIGVYKTRVGAVAAIPQVSLDCPPGCLVGESMPLRCRVRTAGAPLVAARLSIEVLSNGPDDSVSPQLLVAALLPEGVLPYPPSPEGGAALKAGEAVPGPLSLPRVVASQELVLNFVVPAAQVGMLSITATVTAQAVSLGPGAPGDHASKEPLVKDSASADVKMEAPFQLTHAINAMPHTHILLPPSSQAIQAALPSGFNCVSCLNPLLLSTTLHSAARCQVRLLTIDFVPLEDGGAQVAASCGSEGRGHDGQVGALLSKGNAYSCLFHLKLRQTPGPVQLGKIRLRWQREEGLGLPPPQPPGGPANTNSAIQEVTRRMDVVSLSEDTAGAIYGGAAVPQNKEAGRGPVVETELLLPSLVSEEPVILASTLAPPQASAGSPFTYGLRLENPTSVLQEVSVSIGDTGGFVFSGERSGTVSVLPRHSATVNWTMVAYSAGVLTLPDVHLHSARFSAKMRISSSRQMFVMPMQPSGPPAGFQQAVST
mmetsp:Transcript_8771/g.25258  ORF Transcript_8771/g.25258 Transcript_8771/m.25258 type:complete len:1217 (+) Transcript_8771:327-3977(+)